MKFNKLLLLPFLLVSCYKDEGLTTDQSSAWLIGKKWKIEYYTQSESFEDYTLEFEGGWDIIATKANEQKDGRWAVFKGFSGIILQIAYPTYLTDVGKLNGNWSIVDQQMTTLHLRQNNIEIRLKVIE